MHCTMVMHECKKEMQAKSWSNSSRLMLLRENFTQASLYHLRELIVAHTNSGMSIGYLAC